MLGINFYNKSTLLKSTCSTLLHRGLSLCISGNVGILGEIQWHMRGNSGMRGVIRGRKINEESLCHIMVVSRVNRVVSRAWLKASNLWSKKTFLRAKSRQYNRFGSPLSQFRYRRQVSSCRWER